MNEKALVLMDSALTVEQVAAQREIVVDVMSKVMKEGQHYGRIPGCGEKPTLLLSGAQTLGAMFQMFPEYKITERSLNDGAHREYDVRCTLFVRRVMDGVVVSVPVSEGVGMCSSRETKYLMRNAAKEITWTEHPVPQAYWDLKRKSPEDAAKMLLSAFDGPVNGSVGTKKDDSGNWKIVLYHGGDEKVENPNPSDTFNTVLKIAKKRAYVDATITATASSDLFTQDLEDIRENTEAASKRYDAAHEDKPQRVSNTSSAKDWRETPVHFGKNKGKKLRDLTANDLQWYAEKWKPSFESKENSMLKAAAAMGWGELSKGAPSQSSGSSKAEMEKILADNEVDSDDFAAFCLSMNWIKSTGFFVDLSEEEAREIMKNITDAIHAFKVGVVK